MGQAKLAQMGQFYVAVYTAPCRLVTADFRVFSDYLWSSCGRVVARDGRCEGAGIILVGHLPFVLMRNSSPRIHASRSAATGR